MNSIVKYTIIISLSVLGIFMLYIKYIEWDNLKPTIYIDNYSGEKIKILKKDKIWIELENESTEIKRDLKQGTYILYIHGLESNIIDTVRIDIREKKKYIINPFKGMIYTEEQVAYQKMSDNSSKPNPNQIKIAKVFFQSDADFILEEPPNQIKLYPKNKTPQYFNPKINKKYLKRIK